jgi:hypothetical protein
MIGTSRASKQPDKDKSPCVRSLDDGRWALFVDGLARFVEYTREACVTRARAAGYNVD